MISRGRLVAAVAAGAVLVLLLAGCGTASTGSASSGSGSTGSASSGSSTPSATAFVSQSTGPASSAAARPSASSESATAAQRPIRIRVPSIGVDSTLVDLGLAKDGTIEVPTDYRRAGWFDQGPAPGQQGPAVIAGHVDSKTGPAVFYRLADLAPGALIQVTRADGRTVSFRVSLVQRYPKSGFPTAQVYGPVPGPVLRLITCGGAFDRHTGHYRDNVVVYAA